MEQIFIDTSSNTFYIILGFLALGLFFLIKNSYKICPPDKIMIIFGKKRGHLNYRYYIGKHVFALPFIHKVKYLEIVEFTYNNKFMANDPDGNKFKVQLQIIFGISDNPALIKNAIEKILDMPNDRIENLGNEIITEEVNKEFSKGIFHKKDSLKLENDVSAPVQFSLNTLGMDMKGFDIVIYD